MSPRDMNDRPGSPLALSPEEFQRLGRQLLDALAAYQRKLPGRAVRPPADLVQAQALRDQSLPEVGRPPEAVLGELAGHVIDHAFGNDHPGFFAWITAPAAPIGALAEFLAATVSVPSGGPALASVNLEACVVRWLMELAGYPSEGSFGLLVSGGSVANLTALAVARHWAAKEDGWDVRKQGLQGGGRALTLYASPEAHSSIEKAVEVLGLGSDNLRSVPLDAARRMDPAALTRLIAEDRATGRRPFCVVAAAGTTNTGQVDPLAALADLCAAEDLWLHVDGAYGWIGGIDPEKAPLFEGLGRAHSLTLDPHKWLSVPIECGCVLVHDARLQRAAFAYLAPYLKIDPQPTEEVPYWPAEYGIQLTRGARAFKTWATLSQLGRQGVERLVTRHNRLARRLADAIDAAPDLELTAPVALSVVCFRYRPAGWAGSDEALAALNRAVNDAVNETGRYFITPTSLDGRYTLRACILHHETGEAEVDGLLAAVREAGARISSAPSGVSPRG